MKKGKFIILGFLFLIALVSCKSNTNSSDLTTVSEVSSETQTSSEISTPQNSTTTKGEISTTKNTSSITSGQANSTTPSNDPMMIKNIKELGKTLDEDSTLEVSFDGMYVKLITDNTDKLMLFVDDSSYINVRVSNSDFNDYLKNRYLNCYYKVEGLLSWNNNQLEVSYKSITNITSSPEDYDYTIITKECNSILDVYNDIDSISLSKGYVKQNY